MTVVVPANAPTNTTALSQPALPACLTASDIAALGSIDCHGTMPTVT